MDRIHIGTMGWSYDFWAGNFYPEATKSNECLKEYSKHFDTVEIDNTFYRIPSVTSLEKWDKQTPLGFLFSAKFPQIITHRKMLQDCENEVKFFLERISKLQNKLGPLLLQFPPAFGPEKISLLAGFLSNLPKRYMYAVEVRNKNLLNEKLYTILKENNVALTLSTNPSVPQTEQITSNFAYIRWEGDRHTVNGTLGRVEVDRTDDIKSWANSIVGLLDKTKQAFGYFSKYYSGHPPTDAKMLLESLSKAD
jgi:uncharacterized protein YecE (DUF72 family)